MKKINDLENITKIYRRDYLLNKFDLSNDDIVKASQKIT